MGVINTGSFSKALLPGIKLWYGEKYNEHKPEYPQIFKKETSTRAYEEYQGISGLGLAPVKSQGNGISYDETKQGFTTRATNVVYGLGFIVTREMFEDDQYDVIGRQRSRALAFSMRQTKEIVGANLLNRAFNSSYTFGDAKEMCATDHPNVAGGTFANELTTAADLSPASIEQACIDLMSFTNDRGLKINVMPRKLVIPTALTFDAERFVKSTLESGTANNDINAIRNIFPEGIAVNHYLTDSDAWFILTDQEGLVYQERRADEGPLTENDFDTENAKYKSTGRYAFTCYDPRAIFGSPGA